MTNHERRTTTNEKKKGTRDASPHVFGQRAYFFFAAFLPPLAFFAIGIPPFRSLDCASVTPQHRSALCRLARGLDVGDLASANSRSARESSPQSKKIGVLHPSTP
jgi:hypothetical protein